LKELTESNQAVNTGPIRFHDFRCRFLSTFPFHRFHRVLDLYGGDENVLTAEDGGVELIPSVPGREPETETDALSIDYFAIDDQSGKVEC
jgi:hypothetical protein